MDKPFTCVRMCVLRLTAKGLKETELYCETLGKNREHETNKAKEVYPRHSLLPSAV